MPSRISAEIARLARDGGLDLSQVSLRVKADLLMSTPSPAPDDLAAFGEMAATLVPGIDEATAVILARKIAGWRHAPARAVAALRARGGAVLAALIQHGLPLGEAEIEGLAGSSDGRLPAALAERADLTATAVLILVERGERALDFALMGNTAIALPRAALDLLLAARCRLCPAAAGAARSVERRDRAAVPLRRTGTSPGDPRFAGGP